MSKSQAVDPPDKEPKEKPTIRVRIPDDGDVEMSGFSTLQVGKKAKVLVEGKVVEVRDRDGNYEWDNGKSFEIELEGCTIEGPKAKTTISDALEAVGNTL